MSDSDEESFGISWLGTIRCSRSIVQKGVGLRVTWNPNLLFDTKLNQINPVIRKDVSQRSREKLEDNRAA